MNPTSFQPKRRGNVEKKNNSSVNIRLVVKASDSNFCQSGLPDGTKKL